MRIAVIGAGAIGGTIAALLDKAGHTVTVTAREAQRAAINDRGLRLTGGFGDHTANVAAVEKLEGTFDLAFVTTKAQDAESAMAASLNSLAGIPLVVVQNGLESVTAASRISPQSQVIGGLAVFAASFLSPGNVTVTTPGAAYLGGADEPTRMASDVLSAAMPVSILENFEGAQWTKLLVNHVNALPAITGLSVQEVIADRGLRMIMTESMREAVRVAGARGIRFEPLQGLTRRSIAIMLTPPAVIGQLLPLMMGKRMGAQPNPGSTQQSIRRGQPTEIDYLNGAIVRNGIAAGVATPVSEKIVQLVHEVERTTKFLTPGEVRARFARR